jgi:two-component system sensor histidine kinase VicK
LSQVRRYAPAVALAALFVPIQFALVRWSHVPSLGAFYPAVFAAAYFLGLGPAVLVTLLTSSAAAYLFYFPEHNLSQGFTVDAIRHGMYILNSIATSYFLNRARMARGELLRAKAESDFSKRRLDEFFEKAPIPIAVLSGPEFRFELANAQYQALLGPTRQLVGRTVAEAIPELSSEISEVLRRVYRTGERFVGKEYPLALDWEFRGKVYLRYLNFIYEPLRGANGTEGIMVFAYDVSELVQHRMALEESEQQLRAYAEAMPQMAFIAGADGSIIYFNARWYAYVGAEPGVTEGWDWQNRPIHHPDDLEPTLHTWRESLRTGKPYEVQYRLRRHDGEYRWHLGRATPARNREGEIIRWFGTNTDIHEQKLVQEELARAVRARDDFLAVAAHELRTPVTALLLQSQLRRRLLSRQGHAYFGEERLNEMFAQDQRQADRLARLMDDILDVSQLSRDRFVLRLAELNIGAFAAEIAEKMRPAFVAKGVALEVTAAPSLTVPADAARMERAIANLLSNALKYGDRSPVTISVEETGTGVCLAVSDRGPGIAAADQERIFRRFERANGSVDISGLGLGLYITREIVEAHGGTLTLESEAGVKTTFRIFLPGARRPAHLE